MQQGMSMTQCEGEMSEARLGQLLLHKLACERQCIQELGERMFVVGAGIGFVVGVLTTGTCGLFLL